MSYAYNHNGQRIQQSSSGDITYYLWDELSPYGDVVLETDSLNQPTVSYVLGGMQVLSQTKYVYNPPESVSTVTRHLLPDGQGSTRLLTKPNGDAAASQAFEYSAFGDLLSTEAPDTSYLYTGQQYDAATDLYSLRARYYDPGLGRFLSRDTWAYNFQNPVELNRYGYAMANPVNYADPSGYQAAGESGSLLSKFVGRLYAGFKRVQTLLKNDFIQGFIGGVTGWGFGVIFATALGLQNNVEYHDEEWWWEPASIGFDIFWAGFTGGMMQMYSGMIANVYRGGEVMWQDRWAVGHFVGTVHGLVADFKAYVARQVLPWDIDESIDVLFKQGLITIFLQGPVTGGINGLATRVEAVAEKIGIKAVRPFVAMFVNGFIDAAGGALISKAKDAQNHLK